MSTLNLDALFRPQRVFVLGEPQGTTVRTLCKNLQDAMPAAPTIFSVDALAERGGLSIDPLGAHKMPRTLGVVADPALLTMSQIDGLVLQGCRALIWPHAQPPQPEFVQQLAQRQIRLLGARSPGLLRPAGGLQAAALPTGVPTGGLSLIVQSHSVGAAAVDWAAGRQIGFAWAAVTGVETDVDVADLLDYAALDGETQAVIMQVGHIRQGRKFMSAARACARIKPVAVLQTLPGDELPAGRDRVRSAAFARAGLIECRSLPELFDAITALERLPPQSQARVLVVANGASICALGVNAMLREHLRVAPISQATWQRVRQLLPGARWMADALDLGDASVEQTAAALTAMLEDAAVDLLLFIRSPVGEVAHEAFAEALLAVPNREKLLTVWLGLQSALPARRRCADGRIATFTSPEAAARAARHRRDYARNHELLTQTPPRDPALELDGAATTARLRKLIDQGVYHGHFERLADLLSAYRVEATWRVREEAVQVDVQCRRHPEFGVYVQVAQAEAFGAPARGIGFPPLDNYLAARMLTEAGIPGAIDLLMAPDSAAANPVLALPPPLHPGHVASHTQEDVANANAMARALTRTAQLVMDQALIGELDVRLTAWNGKSAALRGHGHLSLTPHPLPLRERTVLAAYPADLTHVWEAGGEVYHLRAVRPTDEQAVLQLLESLDPETIRLRFFGYIRHFSHAMAARMTQIDYDRELALVIQPEAHPDRIVGMGTLVADVGSQRGEFALLVHKEHGGRGLGKHMLGEFVRHARKIGVHEIVGETLAENRTMQSIARQLGFQCRPLFDDPTCIQMSLTA